MAVVAGLALCRGTGPGGAHRGIVPPPDAIRDAGATGTGVVGHLLGGKPPAGLGTPISGVQVSGRRRLLCASLGGRPQAVVAVAVPALRAVVLHNAFGSALERDWHEADWHECYAPSPLKWHCGGS